MKTLEQIEESYRIQHPENGHIKFISVDEKYITVFCEIHNKYAKILKSNITKQKFPCPDCLADWKRTRYQEESRQLLEERLKSNFPDYRLVGNYTNNHIQTEFHCDKCGTDFSTAPREFFRYKDIKKTLICPTCELNRQHKENAERFSKELEKRFPNIKFKKENYISVDTKIDFVCTNCGTGIYRSPYKMLNSCGCPVCEKTVSSGELYVEDWAKENSIDFKKHVKISSDLIEGKFEGSGVEIDFIIQYLGKEYWIEYNGEQHYTWCKHLQSLEKFEGQIRRDKNVKEYCNRNNICLIEIPYKPYNTRNRVYDLLNKIIIDSTLSPNDIPIPEISYNRKKGGE